MSAPIEYVLVSLCRSYAGDDVLELDAIPVTTSNLQTRFPDDQFDQLVETALTGQRGECRYIMSLGYPIWHIDHDFGTTALEELAKVVKSLGYDDVRSCDFVLNRVAEPVY